MQHLKLEKKTQQVAPLSIFFKRMATYGSFAFLLIALSVGVGTVGYYFIGELSWLDSFYMASMILTGMGPVADMKNNAAKVFSSFYALYSGVAFLSITAVFFAPVVHRLLHILHIEDTER